MLICLGAMSIPSFPPPISRQLFPRPEAVMMSNTRWHCPCVIGVHHHGLHTLYKSMGNYRLGLFSPDTQWQRFRVGLGSRGSSSLSLGSEHCGTLLLGSPSPWMLYFEQLVLSTIFVFLVNLSLSVYRLPLVYKLLYARWDRRHHTRSRAGERTVPFGRRTEFTWIP